jgi:hypothetical protein
MRVAERKKGTNLGARFAWARRKQCDPGTTPRGLPEASSRNTMRRLITMRLCEARTLLSKGQGKRRF